MDERGSIAPLIIAITAVLALVVFAVYVVDAHHDHIDNLLESESQDNTAMVTMESITAKFLPLAVIFVVVMVVMALIYGLLRGA